MNRAELKRVISGHMTEKIMDGSLKPDSAPDLISFIDEAIDSREQYLISGLAELVRAWEASMGEDDKSLYTLGLRRAITSQSMAMMLETSRGHLTTMSSHVRKSYCVLCDAKIPVRVTYLYEKELNGWLCKPCWNDRNDSPKTNLKSTLS